MHLRSWPYREHYEGDARRLPPELDSERRSEELLVLRLHKRDRAVEPQIACIFRVRVQHRRFTLINQVAILIELRDRRLRVCRRHERAQHEQRENYTETSATALEVPECDEPQDNGTESRCGAYLHRATADRRPSTVHLQLRKTLIRVLYCTERSFLLFNLIRCSSGIDERQI